MDYAMKKSLLAAAILLVTGPRWRQPAPGLREAVSSDARIREARATRDAAQSSSRCPVAAAANLSAGARRT